MFKTFIRGRTHGNYQKIIKRQISRRHPQELHVHSSENISIKKKQAEQWASDMDANIEAILALTPGKLKKLTPKLVGKMGGLGLFQKLGIELELLTFKDLANEYMKQWSKKDSNQIPRTAYWLEVFGNQPIKAISTSDISKALDHYAKVKVMARANC
ncbi:MAG: hypothetical protein WC685_07420 [Methylobacter sp.]